MHNNPRVNLPKPRPADEERVFAAKELVWEEAILRYKERNCDSKGIQKQDNLTKAQRRGFSKLRERTRTGNIVITTTDKSDKFTVSSRENYILQGAPHIRNDEEVGWKEIADAQKVIKQHCKAIEWGMTGERMVKPGSGMK